MTGERVRYLRKNVLKITQEEFGRRLGVGKTAITEVERGRNALSDQLCRSICREFNVSEQWLRSGEGEMFVSPKAVDLNEFMVERGATDLEVELIKTYFEMPMEARQTLVDHFRKHFSISVPTPASAAAESMTEKETIGDPAPDPMADIEAQVEAYRQQLLAEKNLQTSGDSSPNSGTAAPADLTA